MDITLVLVTLLSLALAAVMTMLAWRLAREERRRSEARVAALGDRRERVGRRPVQSELQDRRSSRPACRPPGSTGGAGEVTMKNVILAALVMLAASVQAQQPASGQSQNQSQSSDQFRFKSGVELINVTATVYDANGRFVPNLRKDDFVVYED